MKALIPIPQTLGAVQIANGCRNPIAISMSSSPKEGSYRLGILSPRQIMRFSFNASNSYLLIEGEPRHDSVVSISAQDKLYTIDLKRMHKYATYGTLYNLRLT